VTPIAVEAGQRFPVDAEKERGITTKRMSVEDCRAKTSHALVVGTGFCACTHAMYDETPDELPERCTETRGGGGRICSLPLGHEGYHLYDCLSRSQWDY
jgi:hypothetical protein